MSKAVTRNALIKRINRRLAHQDERLCVSRSDSAKLTLGDFHILDIYRNLVVNMHVDLEELGTELGVLKAGETFVEQ